MRRKLKNLKNKQGHSANGAPRSLIDDVLYRQINAIQFAVAHHGPTPPSAHCDSEYGALNWATRPRDQAISLRFFFQGS